MNIETQLRAAVSRADTDSRLLHDIVHGDATATVDTEGGPVKLRPGYGLQTVIEDAGGEQRLRFAVTPQLNAGALIALARDFI